MSEKDARNAIDEIIAEKENSLSNIETDLPPGFVGEMAKWIENQSLFERKELSVLSALSVASTAVSVRFTDKFGTVPNLMSFGVADSATGKESIQKSHKQLIEASGLGCCLYGGIKSSAEIVRNIITHQPCIYLIDEFGKKLEKIVRSERGGGSDYLSTVIAELMQVYSNGNSLYVLNGDERKKISSELNKKIAAENKKLDKGDDFEKVKECIDYYLKQIDNFRSGVRSPLLTLTGYTTSQTFQHLMTHDMVTSGFMGRCLLAIENESNPKAKTDFSPTPLPDHFGITLKAIINLGTQKTIEDYRLEFYGEKTILPYDDDAEKYRDEMLKWLIEVRAEGAKQGKSNMEAVARRSCELMLKIAICLGAFSGRVTYDMIKWSADFVKKDYDKKSIMVMSNSKEMGLRGKLLAKMDSKKTVSLSYLINRCGGTSKADRIKKELSEMVINKMIKKTEVKSKRDKLTLIPHYRINPDYGAK